MPTTEERTTDADQLAALQREQAGLTGRIQDAAERGDVTALVTLKAKADALPDLIRAARLKAARSAVEAAAEAITEAEAEYAEAQTAMTAAMDRYQEARKVKERQAWQTEDLRESVKDARRAHKQATETLAALAGTRP